MAGSLGPTNKTLSVSPSVERPDYRNISEYSHTQQTLGRCFSNVLSEAPETCDCTRVKGLQYPKVSCHSYLSFLSVLGNVSVLPIKLTEIVRKRKQIGYQRLVYSVITAVLFLSSSPVTFWNFFLFLNPLFRQALTQ